MDASAIDINGTPYVTRLDTTLDTGTTYAVTTRKDQTLDTHGDVLSTTLYGYVPACGNSIRVHTAW